MKVFITVFMSFLGAYAGIEYFKDSSLISF